MCSLNPEPIKIGITHLTSLAGTQCEDAHLCADPSALPRGEWLTYRREAFSIQTVTETADPTVRNVHPQVNRERWCTVAILCLGRQLRVATFFFGRVPVSIFTNSL